MSEREYPKVPRRDEDQRQTALHPPMHNMIGDTAIGAPAPEVFPAANTATHPGLPVKGYQRQSQWAVDIVNANKEDEERLLRHLDHLKKDGDIDQRWLAVARTQFEKAYMALNRSLFKPTRVTLPEDRG